MGIDKESGTFVLPLIKGNFVVMTACEIRYLQSDGGIIFIYDTAGQKFYGNHTLRFYADLLKNAGFIQVSQSILINLKKIKFIDAVNQELEFLCGNKIVLSRNGIKKLKDYIREHGYEW